MSDISTEALIEIRDTVKTLEERSRNYTKMMDKFDTLLEHHTSKIFDLDGRVAALETLKNMNDKLLKVELDVSTLKTDKKWVGYLFNVASAIIGAALVQIFNIFIN